MKDQNRQRNQRKILVEALVSSNHRSHSLRGLRLMCDQWIVIHYRNSVRVAKEFLVWKVQDVWVGRDMA
jgi:hypothetical protein